MTDPPADPSADPSAGLAVPDHARRLHPLSPVLATGALRPSTLVPFAVMLVVNPLFAAVSAVLTALAALAIGLRTYWTRYLLDDSELTVWAGIWNRTTRVVSPARVQQVELVQLLRHRILGLAAIRIELAGGTADRAAVALDALTLAEAVRVRDALERGRRVLADTAVPLDVPAPPPAALLRVGTRTLALGGLTGAPLLFVPVVVASALIELGRALRDVVEDVAEGAASTLAGSTLWAIVVLAVGGLLLWAAIAVGLMIVRYHGFTLARRGDDVIVTRGLLDTRTSVIPLRRVHLVHESASFVRRLLRLGSLEVRTATPLGREISYGGTVPVAPVADLVGLAALLLRREGWTAPTVAHPGVARRRAATRRAAGLVPAAAVLALAWSPDAAGARLATVVGAVIAAVAVARVWAGAWHRRLGHVVDDGMLVVTEGVLVAHRRSVPLVRAQGVVVTRSPFQRRAGLCTVRIRLAGLRTVVSVPDVSPAQARAIVTAVPGLGPLDLDRWAPADAVG